MKKIPPHPKRTAAPDHEKHSRTRQSAATRTKAGNSRQRVAEQALRIRPSSPPAVEAELAEIGLVKLSQPTIQTVAKAKRQSAANGQADVQITVSK